MPLKIASWALDGVSYLTTKKSVMDHGLSALNGQDCAALRIVTEGSACRSDVPGIAFNDNLSPTPGNQLSAAASVCDITKISQTLPDTQELDQCAKRLISTYGKTGALIQSDHRIERLVREQNTDDAAIWVGIQVAIQHVPDDKLAVASRQPLLTAADRDLTHK